MPRNWEARERKVEKRKNGMRVSNKGIFTVRDSQKKRDAKILHERKEETSAEGI